MSLLLKGARERVEVPCADEKAMMSLQFRIHTLRGAMEHEKHPQYTLVTRAKTTRCYRSDGTYWLLIQPRDSEFRTSIEKAGVTTTEHEQDLLDNPGLAPDRPFDEEIATVLDPYAKFKGG